MTEQRTSVIEVGDEICNHQGLRVTITDVQTGECGLLVVGTFEGGDQSYESFWPYEFHPAEESHLFHNWRHRAKMQLPNGIWVGAVSTSRRQEWDLARCDAEWRLTRDAMRSEEMQSRPTEIRMGS